MRVLCLFLFFSIALAQYEEDPDIIHMCDSPIYCQGPILKAVNLMFRLFHDSKTYVDMPLVKSPNETLYDFKQLFPDYRSLNKGPLIEFIAAHFLPPGKELLPHFPTDWTPEPQAFSVITDSTYHNWAISLNRIWLQLCKKIDPQVSLHPDRYSLIYLPHPFIIPGGRFREIYYWDSYWIIKGLLASGMYNTSKEMILNYVEMVKRFHFVPNGGRIYYLKRTQPPLLVSMVDAYYKETGDKAFVKDVLPQLEEEYIFWTKHRAVSLMTAGKDFTVFRYNCPSNVPRPESYHEDVDIASQLKDSKDARMLFSNIASAAESGWDFSSRWLDDHSSMKTHITNQIIPVDLNAFICQNLKTISDFYELTGNEQKHQEYRKLHENFLRTMMYVFYNVTHGVWFDFDTKANKHDVIFYPSSIVPLYTGCYKDLDRKSVERVLTYLQNTGALSHPAGVPTSFLNTSQQWDYPNGWPPMNHMIVEGLRTAGEKFDSKILSDAAFNLADVWVKNNYLLYNYTTYMFEKYDTSKKYSVGGGGEYDVQVGFGWTNGVALDLLRIYGARLKAPAFTDAENSDDVERVSGA